MAQSDLLEELDGPMHLRVSSHVKDTCQVVQNGSSSLMLRFLCLVQAAVTLHEAGQREQPLLNYAGISSESQGAAPTWKVSGT
ncbi:hypothetical protein N8T08_009188 [Aspergillus melleus]|uniref:Uncharacterized protein n=1 Tax=Aspergillus melleus TaxID=138277 RepID=A0ACC3AV59_9EURO|nr:hypothetical protein N8T08_009188 [Aspergillus melleus]